MDWFNGTNCQLNMNKMLFACIKPNPLLRSKWPLLCAFNDKRGLSSSYFIRTMLIVLILIAIRSIRNTILLLCMCVGMRQLVLMLLLRCTNKKKYWKTQRERTIKFKYCIKASERLPLCTAKTFEKMTQRTTSKCLTFRSFHSVCIVCFAAIENNIIHSEDVPLCTLWLRDDYSWC